MLTIILAILLSLILILAVIVFLIPLDMRVEYVNNKLVIKLKIFGRFRNINIRNMKEKAIEETVKSPTFKEVLSTISKIKELYKVEKPNVSLALKEIRTNINILNYDGALFFGFGNAAITGLASVPIKAFVSAIRSIFNRTLSLDGLGEFSVTPVYDKKTFEIKFSLLINFKLYKLLILIIFLYKLYKSEKEVIQKILERNVEK